jgi:hypothetical protein
VDLFIAECLKAGVANPAMLPLDNDGTLSPPIRALLATRIELDRTICQTRAAFPDPIDDALKASDAIALLAVLTEEFGGTVAVNMCLWFASIAMLRLELYTGLGVYMTPGCDRVTDAQYLADPFSGGQLYADLLAEAVSFTRLLEGLFSLNPTLDASGCGIIPLVFQTCCLHIAFRRRLMRTFQGAVGYSEKLNGSRTTDSHDIYASIDRDYRVCFNVLEAYAARFSFLMPLYRLACKIADMNDAEVSAAELEMARGSREPGTEPGPMQDFASLLGAYQPATVGPRLLAGLVVGH